MTSRAGDPPARGPDPSSDDTEAEGRLTREITARAIRRLGILEAVILVAAVFMALVAGALAAFLLGELLGAPFRPTWAGASILLFVIPALLIWLRDRRS